MTCSSDSAHSPVSPGSMSGSWDITSATSGMTSSVISWGTLWGISWEARVSMSAHLYQRGVALAPAAAQGRGSEAAIPAAQLLDERDDQPGARHADGMPEGDGAAVAGRHGALRGERRLEACQLLDGGLRTDPLVGLDGEGIALALRHGDGNDLARQAALLGGVGRPLVAPGGELVLGRTWDGGALGVAVGPEAHVDAVEGAPKPVVDHSVDRL